MSIALDCSCLHVSLIIWDTVDLFMTISVGFYACLISSSANFMGNTSFLLTKTSAILDSVAEEITSFYDFCNDMDGTIVEHGIFVVAQEEIPPQLIACMKFCEV